MILAKLTKTSEACLISVVFIPLGEQIDLTLFFFSKKKVNKNFHFQINKSNLSIISKNLERIPFESITF